MGDVTGQQLVEWTERDFPGRTPGRRVAHTVGIGVTGTFVPSDVIRSFSVAPVFNSGVQPVLVRFSNGSGLADERDLHTDAHGLAIKFFRGDPEREHDMVAMNMPAFFVKTGADFEEFSEASIPVPVEELRISRLRRFGMMLQLKQPPDPPPSDVSLAISPAKLVAYARRHPESKAAIAALGTLVSPVSYGRACYQGIHAFMARDSKGIVRPARYQWDPLLGVRGVSDEERKSLPDDYLHRDLRSRLERDVIRFTLQITLGEQGDDATDPTTHWPVARRRITAGVLTLDQLVADQQHDQELVSFNPARTHDGFDVSDDDLLWARKLAYEYSCSNRHGHGCPVMH